MKGKERFEAIFRHLPPALVRELTGLLRGFDGSPRELRLRANGTSRIVFGGASYPLYTRLDGEMLTSVVDSVCRGSLYAYRDRLASGAIALAHGIRVAVVGEARYDGGRLVGIDGISSAVFRIPTDPTGVADGLYRDWLTAGGGNMLVCAPPLGGKTTVLRSLAGLIGSGSRPRRVVVVDGMCEFDPFDYSGASVDILRGYERGKGTELAFRMLSPEVMIVDEIASAADAAATRDAIGVGVPVIASVHGSSASDLMRRGYIASMIRDGCFGICAVIRSDSAGGFCISAPERLAV